MPGVSVGPVRRRLRAPLATTTRRGASAEGQAGGELASPFATSALDSGAMFALVGCVVDGVRLLRVVRQTGLGRDPSSGTLTGRLDDC